MIKNTGTKDKLKESVFRATPIDYIKDRLRDEGKENKMKLIKEILETSGGQWNQVDLAKRYGLYDRLSKLGRELETIDGVKNISFSLDNYGDTKEIIFLADYDIPMENFYDLRRVMNKRILEVAKKYGLKKTEDEIEDYGESLYYVFDDTQANGVKESISKKKDLKENFMDAIFDRIDNKKYGVPYIAKDFYDYIGYFNDDIASALDSGTEDDVREAIIRGIKASIKGDGGNPDNPNAKQLYDWVRQAVWTEDVKAEDDPPTPKYLTESMVRLNEGLNTTAKDLAAFLKEAKEDLENGGEGVWHRLVGTTRNGTELYCVVGLVDAGNYDEEDLEYLATDDTNKWVICGKIAVNNSSLQSDYEFDWTIPYDEESGFVWGTENELHEEEDYIKSAVEFLEETRELLKYEIAEDGKILKNYEDKWDVLLARINDLHGALKIESVKKVGKDKFDFVASGYKDMFKLLFHTHLGKGGVGYQTLIIDSIDILESEIPEERLKEILTPSYMIWDQGVYKLTDYLRGKHILKYADNGNDLVYDEGATVYLPDKAIKTKYEESIWNTDEDTEHVKHLSAKEIKGLYSKFEIKEDETITDAYYEDGKLHIIIENEKGETTDYQPNIEKGKRAMKESRRMLKEEVSDEAYKVAEKLSDVFNSISTTYKNRGIESDLITWDEFDEQFAIAIREVFGVDNVWEYADENDYRLPNGVDLQDFEVDVRGILSYSGWTTIWEGDEEGGLEKAGSRRMSKEAIIYQALKEYENRHYQDKDESWQEVINNLIDEYSDYDGELEEGCKSRKGKKALKEDSYGWQVNPGEEWDLYEELLDYFGAEKLVDMLAKAMGTQELGENCEYICRMYDFESNHLKEGLGKSISNSRLANRAAKKIGVIDKLDLGY